MYRQLDNIWEELGKNLKFKEALIAKLTKDYQTQHWERTHWHSVGVIYDSNAIKVELDVQRVDGEFIVRPVFAGQALTSVEPIKFPISEVEGGDDTLKEFRVRVSHDVVEEGFITVQAFNDKEAIQKARIADHSDIEWGLTDAMGDNQYDIAEE
jgi:hypothetical protein